MIKLEKLPEPQVLRDNKANWTNAYLNALGQGSTVSDTLKTRYRHADVKSQIKAETNEKCAYCESKIDHIYAGDIEHIIPKSKFPNLIFEWTNLTYCCGECNRRKLDYYDDQNPLLNPYTDNPEEHLIAAGDFIVSNPGSKKGLLTQLKLELNRVPLLERRRERLMHLQSLLELYTSVEGEVKELLKRQLMQEVDKSKEYSFAVQAFITACGVSCD